MAKILLDYFFKITAINPTPAASTAFLKQVCVVAYGEGDDDGVFTLATSSTAAQALVESANAKAEIAELFNAGLNRVYVLTTGSLDIADILEDHQAEFYTLLITSDFTDADLTEEYDVAAVRASLKIQDITYTAVPYGTGGNNITINYNTGGTAGEEVVTVVSTAISIAMQDGVSTAAQIKAAIDAYPAAAALVTCAVDAGDEGDVQAVFGAAVNLENGASATINGLDVGSYPGVVGFSSTDSAFCAEQAAIENRCCFFTKVSNGAKNCFFAFGSMLSNSSDWKNQQYITMPFDDEVDELGEAEAFFDDKVSFVILDDEFSRKLSLFCCGGKSIVAPYILRNLEVDLQSKGLQYVSANQPGYTFTHAALLEDELQKVIDGDGLENGNRGYVGRGWLTSGTVNITLENDNFVASGSIQVPTPRSLWRVDGTLTQS